MVAGDYYNVKMNALPKTSLKGMYQGGEPYEGNETLDADGVAMRTWSWIAWQYRIDYLCYYSMAEAWRRAIPEPAEPQRSSPRRARPAKTTTTRSGTTLETGHGRSPRGSSSIRGKMAYDMPIVNIRMKQIRRGQTDYEYFWLLRQAGEGALADSLVKRVIRVALSEAAQPPSSTVPATGRTIRPTGTPRWRSGRPPRRGEAAPPQGTRGPFGPGAVTAGAA